MAPPLPRPYDDQRNAARGRSGLRPYRGLRASPGGAEGGASGVGRREVIRLRRMGSRGRLRSTSCVFGFEREGGGMAPPLPRPYADQRHAARGRSGLRPYRGLRASPGGASGVGRCEVIRLRRMGSRGRLRSTSCVFGFEREGGGMAPPLPRPYSDRRNAARGRSGLRPYRGLRASPGGASGVGRCEVIRLRRMGSRGRLRSTSCVFGFEREGGGMAPPLPRPSVQPGAAAIHA